MYKDVIDYGKEVWGHSYSFRSSQMMVNQPLAFKCKKKRGERTRRTISRRDGAEWHVPATPAGSATPTTPLHLISLKNFAKFGKGR